MHETQDNANHIHSVWRDFSGDFGGDRLKTHYETSHRTPEGVGSISLERLCGPHFASGIMQRFNCKEMKDRTSTGVQFHQGSPHTSPKSGNGSRVTDRLWDVADLIALWECL